mmetsp:Transcript_14208/g.20298  ORF Transcript_14208/g.20298 Transcript_14208/m.20298 type:complete len:94 (-) Transcript_14208:31-312(-)
MRDVPLKSCSNLRSSENCKVQSDYRINGIVDCIVCGNRASNAHFCSICNYFCHLICSHTNGGEGYGSSVSCFRCVPSTSVEYLFIVNDISIIF